ncbi:MAG TPA: M56 family metallopeptidase [Sedimentisphaerales bacterium]|jgi:beta-lactamase regulating signal transducer with metallopeptidase domain|nr:M56 family metallopeptidase [Sedimentisphaerales bacterium]HNU29582.1 M56 family metallopeptidase [Sedimentisphaerales bacterium]
MGIHETSAADVAQPPGIALGQADTARGFAGDVTLREATAIAWLAGALMFVTAVARKAGRMTRWLLRERRIPPPEIRSELCELLSPTHRRRMPNIWLVEGIGQPFVWGLFRGDIYLPASFASADQRGRQKDVLAHEVSHVLRCDAAVNLLQVVSQAFFWFHPLVWWANRRIRAEREKSCNEMAIARLGARPREYSRAIVETLLNEHSSLRQVPSLAVAGPVKNIEERIKTMLRPGRKFHEGPSLLAVLFVVLLGLLIVPTTLALTRRPAERAAATLTVAETPADSARQDRRLSASRLHQIGEGLDRYADNHNGVYPDGLMSLVSEYITRDLADEVASFVAEHAEYLAAGKKRPDANLSQMPLAYDLTLFRMGEGTNIVFADAHVEFVRGARLGELGIRLPTSHLEVVEVRFEPIHQGKNAVHVTVKNTSDKEQVFATHIYTRSPDYGVDGVGWGTGFFETIGPEENKPVCFVFKIQGPVTNRTYVNLSFHNPDSRESYDSKHYFEKRRYTSDQLPKARPDRTARKPAPADETKAVMEAFHEIQGFIQQTRYEQAWQRFTEDFRKAEYQRDGLQAFRKAMEPTHPLHSAFTWERDDFLKLAPQGVTKTDGVFALRATCEGQTWTIDFVRQDDLWKIDWIAGYTPKILDIQKQDREPAMPQVGNNAATGNLRISDIKFDPIQKGKNVVRLQVQNLTEQDQVFAVSVQARSPDVGGWGTTFFDTIQAGRTQWTRCAFAFRGAIAGSAHVELSFYDPGPAAGFDAQKWFAGEPWDHWFDRHKYFGRDLPQREAPRLPLPAASQDQAKAALDALEAVRTCARQSRYEDAWNLFTRDYRDAGYFRKFAIFKNRMEQAEDPDGSGEFRKALLGLKPGSVAVRDNALVVTATYEQQEWTIDLVQEDGLWKVDWIDGDVDSQPRKTRWEDSVLPKIEKRSAAHFDIYYHKDSTAAREIDQIARDKDRGFDEICRFLGKDSDIRIRLVLFEDGDTKQRATGHQGAGWAYGATIVEVYNEKERLDPYHETTHILMGPLGSPPALFNEGFATYMSERLGAPALENLGGGKTTLHQRVRDLQAKGDWIPLSELLSYTEIGSARSRPFVAYPEAGSFVQFLIDTHGKDKFLQAYGTLRNSDQQATRKENAQSLARIYGQRLDSLETQWLDVISRAK